MSVKKIPCGFECVFSDKSNVWQFFNFLDGALDQYYFCVADLPAAYVAGKRIEIYNEFNANYLEELIRKKVFFERLVLHLYPQNAKPKEIDNYCDFLGSQCEMIILLYDVVYLEIYCKNQCWLQNLMYAAANISGTVVEEKYEDTDTRTTMYV